MTVDTLPAGPRWPALLQSAAWIVRPWEFMNRARYGDAFTLRFIGEAPMVMVADPDVVREVFTGPPELLHAGEAYAVVSVRLSRRWRCELCFAKYSAALPSAPQTRNPSRCAAGRSRMCRAAARP